MIPYGTRNWTLRLPGFASDSFTMDLRKISRSTTTTKQRHTFYFFSRRRGRRQIFSNSLKSFGFLTDHPLTTYMNVLKFSIFGGGGQLTLEIEKISLIKNKKIKCVCGGLWYPTHTTPIPLLATPQEGGLATHPLTLLCDSEKGDHSRPFDIVKYLILIDSWAQSKTTSINITLHFVCEKHIKFTNPQLDERPLRCLSFPSLNLKARQLCWHGFRRLEINNTKCVPAQAGTSALTRTTRKIAS